MGVSTIIHPWIVEGVSLIPISLYVIMNEFNGGQMGADPREYRFNSESWTMQWTGKRGLDLTSVSKCSKG